MPLGVQVVEVEDQSQSVGQLQDHQPQVPLGVHVVWRDHHKQDVERRV